MSASESRERKIASNASNVATIGQYAIVPRGKHRLWIGKSVRQHHVRLRTTQNIQATPTMGSRDHMENESTHATILRKLGSKERRTWGLAQYSVTF